MFFANFVMSGASIRNTVGVSEKNRMIKSLTAPMLQVGQVWTIGVIVTGDD